MNGNTATLRRLPTLSRIAGLVALVVICLAGAPASPADAQTMGEITDADREAIAELLESRARSTLQRDLQTFMSTVDPTSKSFAARQRELFDGASLVPFESYTLEAVWDRYGDMRRPSDADRYQDADNISIPVVEERYRIQSQDESDVVEELFLTFVKRDGRWLVAADDDLNDLGFLSARHVWDYGPVQLENHGRFTTLTPTCCPGVPARLLDVAEAGYERASRFWSGARPKRVLVMVPADGVQLKRILQATFDIDDFVAFALSFVDPTNGFSYSGPRIIFGPGAFGGDSSGRILNIMAHELLHVMTRPASSVFVPIFLEEGFADYTGHDADPGALGHLRSVVASGEFDGEFPEDYEFTTGDSLDIYTSYQEGHSAVRYFVEQWGLANFNRFYLDLGGRRIEPGVTRYHVDAAMQDTVGVGFDAFERGWASSINS
ncbi:MAG TPA: hypothetical protein VNC78_03275 [Actinomycetota bacterium]|nr:hypothetical protein [Actinomycetota bacterium]